MTPDLVEDAVSYLAGQHPAVARSLRGVSHCHWWTLDMARSIVPLESERSELDLDEASFASLLADVPFVASVGGAAFTMNESVRRVLESYDWRSAPAEAAWFSEQLALAFVF